MYSGSKRNWRKHPFHDLPDILGYFKNHRGKTPNKAGQKGWKGAIQARIGPGWEQVYEDAKSVVSFILIHPHWLQVIRKNGSNPIGSVKAGLFLIKIVHLFSPTQNWSRAPIRNWSTLYNTKGCGTDKPHATYLLLKLTPFMLIIAERWVILSRIAAVRLLSWKILIQSENERFVVMIVLEVS